MVVAGNKWNTIDVCIRICLTCLSNLPPGLGQECNLTKSAGNSKLGGGRSCRNINDALQKGAAIPQTLDREEEQDSVNLLRLNSNMCKDLNLGSKSPLKQSSW